MGFSYTSVVQWILRIICAFVLTTAAHAEEWQILAPGIAYLDLGNRLFTPWSHIHVFKIDLKNNKFEMVMANELSQPNASVDEFAHFSKALISINGGFFDEKFNSLGLRVSNQAQHSPLKRISWWGIFYIKNNTPHVSNLFQYSDRQNIDFAVQSGPRLIIDSHIPSLKPGMAERTALGITTDGQVIIVVTDKTPMTTTDLAKLMRLPPLSCVNALNLDGGSSTQLYAKLGAFRAQVHGFANVADAIIVKSKN